MVTIASPDSPEQLEEALSDPKQLAELVADPVALKEFFNAYAIAFRRQDKNEMESQLKGQMKQVLEEFYATHNTPMNDNVKRLPMSEEAAEGANGSSGSVYKNLEMTRNQKLQIAATGKGPGVYSEPFENFVDFARSISPHITHREINAARMKVLNEGEGDQGGFLVPEEFRAELLMLALETAIIRPRARVLPMSGLTVRIPAIRDTTHATNVHGGVQAFWVPESGTLTQSEPTFSQVMLTAKKLIGATRVTNEMLRDSSVTFEPLINTLFANAISYFEDDAFINGIGGGQPLGILNADALISVAKETGQAASTLVVENVIKMFSRLMPESMSRAVWVMNSDVIPQLYTLSLAVGTGGAPMFFPAGGISGAPSATLLGRPIVFTEKAQTLGTAGDVYLVDLSYYLIGDRQALEMASSAHVRFNTDETDFRFVQRVDGRPWIDSALTPRNGSNTLSPFVSIATRA